MKILLTGGQGFIGQALLPQLLANGHQLTLLTRQPAPAQPAAVRQIIADAAGWADAVRGQAFDLCIHLAWIATPGVYLDSPQNHLLASATSRLAESLFAAGLPHFLALGTCIEYAPGQSAPCRPGTTPIAPATIYGQAKEQARQGIAAAAERYHGNYTWVRLFYPYGAGEHPQRIPSTFIRTLLENRPLIIKTPDSIKDFIEIRDVASALLHLSEHAGAQQEINLGSGTGTRIADLAALAARLVGADPALVQCAATPAADPYPCHIADAHQLRACGWRPAITLEDGITRLIPILKSITL